MNRFYQTIIGAAIISSMPLSSSAATPHQATSHHGVTAGQVSRLIGHQANLRSSQQKILAEKKVTDGVIMRAVATPDGRIYKQIERNGIVSPIPQRHHILRATETGVSLYEGFEGWDEVTYDWIPEGWTEINTPENVSNQIMLESNINNTWYGCWTGDGYWTGITTDGEKECFIHFTYSGDYLDENGEPVEFSAAMQNEWLISKQFKLNEQHKLFFELEIDEGAIFMYDWGTYSYDRNTIDCDLEILISDDNGENWNRLWIASEDLVADKTDKELYDKMAMLAYQSMSIDIPEQYFGKDVKIAFRYYNRGEGFCGNSMAIDGITVGATMPEAMYGLPSGTLLTGLSRDFYAFEAPFALFPANADITWESNCNAFTESKKWQVYNQETGETDTFEGDNVTTHYSYSAGEAYPFPILTAENTFGQDVYNFGIVEDSENEGGTLYGGSMISDGIEFGAGVYDYAHGSMYPAFFSEGNYCFGTTAAGTWGNNIAQISSSNMYDHPAAPYAIDEIYVTLGALDADPDAEITLDILGYLEDGSLDASHPLATATAKIADAVKEDQYYQLPFKFYTENENGEKEQTYFIYDRPMIVDIHGYYNNPKIRNFGICTQYFNNESGKNYAAMRILFENENVVQWYTADTALKDFYNALFITFFGSFNFLEPEETVINIDPETRKGGTYVAGANTPEDWWIMYKGNKYPLIYGAELDGWLTVSVMTMNDEHRLSFKATETDALRSLDFELCTKGASTTLTVNQNPSAGVSEIEATEIYNVEYFNTLGQKVSDTTKGIVVKKVNYTDGTVKTTKVINN